MHSFFDSIHVKQCEIATCIIDLWGCTEISPKVRSGAAHCFNLEKKTHVLLNIIHFPILAKIVYSLSQSLRIISLIQTTLNNFGYFALH